MSAAPPAGQWEHQSPCVHPASSQACAGCHGDKCTVCAGAALWLKHVWLKWWGELEAICSWPCSSTRRALILWCLKQWLENWEGVGSAGIQVKKALRTPCWALPGCKLKGTLGSVSLYFRAQIHVWWLEKISPQPGEKYIGYSNLSSMPLLIFFICRKNPTSENADEPSEYLAV